MRRNVALEITRAEIQVAKRVGGFWFENGQRIGAKDKLGRPYDAAHLRDMVRGAAAEVVFARFMGIPYDEVGALTAFNSRPDVGGYNVRCAKEPCRSLIVRTPEEDNPNPGRFALVRYLLQRTFLVAGWMHTDEIRVDQYWRPSGGKPLAWWVPHYALHPFT